MSDRDLFALFYFTKGEPLGRLEDLVRRAGVTGARTRSWGTGVVQGAWGGLSCESHLLQLSCTTVLVVNFREDDFHAMREGAGELIYDDGAIDLAHSFRDSCLALQPLAAFISTYPFPMDFEVAEKQEAIVVNRDVAALVEERFNLFYLSPDQLAELQSRERLAARDMLPAGSGLLLFGDSGPDRW
ncbi:hypothetical protein ABZ622_37490 [Streptomyces sp. NPDC007164]|uniref:hypothetical protein n=1 Tax=Streptomyces sp. NPDC007164 TaxID=3156918 RepID=UPI0033CA660D